MITLVNMINFIDLILNKDQSGRSFTPEQKNTAFQVANIDLYRELVNDFDRTLLMSELLNPFKVVMGYDTSVMNVDKWGKAVKPLNFDHFVSANHYITSDGCDTDVKPVSIELIKESSFADRITDSIKLPTLEFPIVLERSAHFVFYPRDIRHVEFIYLRKPIAPSYVIDDSEEVETIDYSDGASVDFEWDEKAFLKLASRILSYLGINLRETELVQYAELLGQKSIVK